MSNIQIGFLGERHDPFEDIVEAASDEEGNQLPLYLIYDNDNLVVYFANTPFTKEQAEAAHSIDRDEDEEEIDLED